MAALTGEVLTENNRIMKQAVRSKIFQQSELMRDNLFKGTEFVYSKQNPTQVIDIKGTRYIRINDADIDEESIDDLLSLMLGVDMYKEVDGEDPIDRESIIKEAIQKNKDFDGQNLYESDIIESDEYENITNLDELPIQPQVVRAKATKEEQEEDESKLEEELEEEAKGSGSMAEEAAALDEAMHSDVDGEAQVHEAKAEMDIEQALEEVETFSGKSYFSDNHSLLSAEEISALRKKAHKLLKAFRGFGGKVKKITPAKKTCAKSMAMDRDKVYYKNTADQGKHINMNFLIDMSGSMCGEPVKNAVSLVYLFNILAKEGYLSMNVLYSESSNNYKLTLPASDAEILGLHETGNAEGLARTVHEHIADISNTNLICLTDGNICDEPIAKDFWSKHRIVSTGVYVNSRAKDLREFTGTLNKWFNHSLVRQNLDELIEVLIKIGLK